jgi:hypothetical protein
MAGWELKVGVGVMAGCRVIAGVNEMLGSRVKVGASVIAGCGEVVGVIVSKKLRSSVDVTNGEATGDNGGLGDAPG